jgi:hypothetical protein
MIAAMLKSDAAQDTSGVHLWLVLMKAFHALATVAGKSLNVSVTGLGDSDFRVLEVLLHKGPLTNTFREHAVAMEAVAAVLSKEQGLILLRLLKKPRKGGEEES